MTAKSEFGFTHARGVGLARVFCVIKDEDVSARSFCGDDARVLRHVASAVDFTLVVDLDINFNLAGYCTETTEL